MFNSDFITSCTGFFFCFFIALLIPFVVKGFSNFVGLIFGHAIELSF